MDCITLTEFAHRLDKEIAGSRLPLTGSIEVTARCNMHCAHCYINLPANDYQAKKRELTYTEICDVIDQIVDEGCLWLLLTGGEPFLRPDFLDIYIYAKKKGLLITLFTNGTTVTPYVADHLSEWRPFSIEITLYGYTKNTYEKITGIPGSFEHCMRGIELIRNRNLPLKLKTMVMTLNKHEVWDMKKYAEDLGIDFQFDPQLNVRLDGNQKPEEFRITPEEVVTLDLADEKRMKEWREFCEKFWYPPIYPDCLYQCSAGLNTFHIDSNGNLSVCILSRIPSFDLKQGKFNEGWYDFMPIILSQKKSQKTPCKNCELISLCGQCPGWAQMEHGNQEKPVEYLCKIAHKRAEAFGLNMLEKRGKL